MLRGHSCGAAAAAAATRAIRCICGAAFEHQRADICDGAQSCSIYVQLAVKSKQHASDACAMLRRKLAHRQVSSVRLYSVRDDAKVQPRVRSANRISIRKCLSIELPVKFAMPTGHRLTPDNCFVQAPRPAPVPPTAYTSQQARPRSIVVRHVSRRATRPPRAGRRGPLQLTRTRRSPWGRFLGAPKQRPRRTRALCAQTALYQSKEHLEVAPDAHLEAQASADGARRGGARGPVCRGKFRPLAPARGRRASTRHGPAPMLEKSGPSFACSGAFSRPPCSGARANAADAPRRSRMVDAIQSF